MRSTTRRTALVGTAAGLTLALASPLTATANASGHHNSGPEHGRHGWHSSSNPAEHTARKALRTAIKAASAQFRMSVRTACIAFHNDPIVMAAADARHAIVDTAVDPALIIAANDAYLAAVSGPQATKDAAIEAATTAWTTAVDAAYTAYDTATTSADEAAARATFRTSVRTATVAFRTSMRTACTDFKTATAPARASLRASVNAAQVLFLASPQAQSDIDAFKAAVHTAREAFGTDTAVIAAKDARRTATTAARTTYRSAIKAARDVFFVATGHNPHRIKMLLPQH